MEALFVLYAYAIACAIMGYILGRMHQHYIDRDKEG